MLTRFDAGPAEQFVDIAETSDEFTAALERALDRDAGSRRQLTAAMAAEGWREKVEIICERLENHNQTVAKTLYAPR